MALKFNDANFASDVLEAKELVVVDFYADWCGPCKMMAPIIDELANQYTDVKIGKLNVDDSPQTSKNYRVMSIPTILLIKNGQVVESIVGLVSKAQLVDKINAHK